MRKAGGMALLCLVAAFCLLAASSTAAAPARQDSVPRSPSAASDSTAGKPPSLAEIAAMAAAAAADTAASTDTLDHFTPVSSSSVKGGESDIALRSDMVTTIMPNGFWTFNSLVSYEQRKYRTRDMQDINKSFVNSAAWMKPELCLITMSVGENYIRKKTLGLARAGTEIVFDNENAALSASLLKKLPGTSETQLVANARGSRGQNDFKYDRTYSGDVSGRLGMYVGEKASVSGGAAVAMRRESSEVGDTLFGPLRSHSDTLTLNASIGDIAMSSEKKPFVVNCLYAEGVDRAVTLKRGNYGEKQKGAEQEEEISQQVGSVAMSSFLEPLSDLSLNLKFSYDMKSQDYSEENQRSGKTKISVLDATTAYKYASRGTFTAAMSNRKSIFDIGQGGISSYRETERRLSGRLSQELGEAFTFLLIGGTSLLQKFYEQPDKNPRDQDVLNYAFEGHIASVPFTGVKAGVDAAVTKRRTINIDRSLSKDNLTEWFYTISPNYSFQPKPWATVGQAYQIKFEYEDFAYNEDKNYLTRSTTLRTNASFNIGRPIVFGFAHSYLFWDSGSYLWSGGEQRYSSTMENYEHTLLLSLDYTLRDGTTAWCDTEFRNQQSNRLGFREGRKEVLSSTYNDSGGLKVGLTRKKALWKDGELGLNIVYNRRFALNLEEKRREFWDVDAVLRINF